MKVRQWQGSKTLGLGVKIQNLGLAYDIRVFPFTHSMVFCILILTRSRLLLRNAVFFSVNTNVNGIFKFI